MCLCDNIGLVALILLGWELRASSITVLCVQAVKILSPLLFMPSLYSHSNSKNFYITCGYPKLGDMCEYMWIVGMTGSYIIIHDCMEIRHKWATRSHSTVAWFGLHYSILKEILMITFSLWCMGLLTN